MIQPLPKAWIGYGADKKGGFVVRVCPLCPDKHKAVLRALPLKTREELCVEHYQQQLAKNG